MSDHVNHFYTAVSVLAGHGLIKQRLVKAYEENLAGIEDEDLPIAVKQSFVDLRHMMSRVDPVMKRGGRSVLRSARCQLRKPMIVRTR